MKTKSILVCSFIIMNLFLVSNNVFAQGVNVKDSLALIDLYNSTNGSGWYNKTNWLTGPVKTWYGITLENKSVTEINLYANKLAGSIPSSIGNITNLKILGLGNNNTITGNIPVEISNLTNLTVLDLFNNQLTGTIPSQLGNLTNLIQLRIGQNQLSGNIPSSFGNLVHVTYLFLGYNQLTGSIPSQLGLLVNLKIWI